MADAIIRPARPEDLPAIYSIYCHYVDTSEAIMDLAPQPYDDFFRRMSGLLEQPYFVVEKDGELIGYAYLHPAFEKEGYRGLSELSIYFKEGPHHGMALPLMETIIQEAENRKHRMLISCITCSNESSIRLHEKTGFSLRGRLDKAGRKFGRLHDVCWYVLDLEEGGTGPEEQTIQ